VAGDHQSGGVDSTLPVPLQVNVSRHGRPMVGALVSWETNNGHFSPGGGRTDSLGNASATWTLGRVAGAATASAAIDAKPAKSVEFAANVSPDIPSGIRKFRGDSQSVRPHGALFDTLVAQAVDKYGNGVPGQRYTWTVVTGPVAITSVDTGAVAWATTAVLSQPTQSGDAIVQVTTLDSLSAEFTLAVDPHAPIRVTLDAMSKSFTSRQNASSPAVDTIAVGDSVRFWLDWGFDYTDTQFSVVPVGIPAFRGGGDFQSDLIVGVFPAAGTYHYRDSHHPNATGTVVVEDVVSNSYSSH
jgi:plastocyanin